MEDNKEEEKEMSVDDKARAERLSKKFDAFLEDISEDMVDKEHREKIENKVKAIFSKDEIPYSSKYILAFVEGMEFMLSAITHDQSLVAPVLTTMKGIAIRKRRELAEKVDKSMSASSK